MSRNQNLSLKNSTSQDGKHSKFQRHKMMNKENESKLSQSTNQQKLYANLSRNL